MSESSSGRRARPEVPGQERVVVGDDSRIREVSGTRDARRDLAHERGDTVERQAIVLDDQAARPAPPASSEPSDDQPGEQSVARPLAGFFTGMAYALLMPVLWFWISDPESIGDLISTDVVFFVPTILLPIALAAVPRTRTFGLYMLLGVVLSGFVVLGVAAIVVSFLIFTGR